MSDQILVIDDEESVRDAFQLSLADIGYEVRVAASGEEGVALAADRMPDLVFLDLKMPDMNGVEVMRRLLAQYPALRIYIVTAFYPDYMQELAKAREAGLSFELAAKPLAPEQIRLVTASIFGRLEE